MAIKIEQPVKILDDSFYDIVGIKIKVSSQLNMFNILIDPNDIKYINIFKTYVINENILNNAMLYYTHEIGYDEWWDNISNEYYGTPDLWWIISTMNSIVNPFESLNEGDLLKILKPEFIPQVLKDIEIISKL